MRCPTCGEVYTDAYRFCPEDGTQLLTPAPAREGRPVSVTGILQRGWELFQQDLALYAGFRVLVALGLAIIALVAGKAAAGVVTVGLLPFVAYGDSIYALKRAAGEQPVLGDVLLAVHHYGSLLLASVVIPALLALGYAALILPGVYLTVCWAAAPLLILDRDRSVWEALAESRTRVHRRWFTAFFALGAVALVYLVLAWISLDVFYGLWYRFYFGPGDAALVTLLVLVELLSVSVGACIVVALYEAVFGTDGRWAEPAAPEPGAGAQLLPPLTSGQEGEPL